MTKDDEPKKFTFAGYVAGHYLKFTILESEIQQCIECGRDIDLAETRMVEWRNPEGVVAVCQQCQIRNIST